MMSLELAGKAREVSLVFKQMAHPVRLRILCCLVEGEKSVGELVDFAGAAQSWVSQFLARMRADGLVDSRKEGAFVYYRIADERLKAVMSAVHSAYCKPGRRRRSA